MKKTFLLFAFSLVLGKTMFAQEGIPVYFDYLTDNYYLVYPAMAGIGNSGKVRLTARQQWFDIENAPNLQTFNAHFRVGEKTGVGGILFNDANGYHSQGGFKGTFAYHLNISRDPRQLNQFSFGISSTLLVSRLDETEFQSTVADPAISGNVLSSFYFNTDFGFSYNYQEFYFHSAINNMLSSTRDLYRESRTDDPDNLSVPRVDNLRRYLISMGYVYGKDLRIEPSILFQATEFSHERTIDFNAKIYNDLNDDVTLWGGFSYRRSFEEAQFEEDSTINDQRLQLITPLVGADVKRFMVSYNYTYQMGDIRASDGGFHQITLGYFFGDRQDRFDCYCPAANY